MSPYNPLRDLVVARGGMGGRLLMSAKERIRRVELEGVKEGRLSIREASSRLGISYRQGKRICRRFREKGDAGLVHRGRGRPSNRSTPCSVKDRAVARYRERYEGFGPTLASEKLSAEGLPVDHESSSAVEGLSMPRVAA